MRNRIAAGVWWGWISAGTVAALTLGCGGGATVPPSSPSPSSPSTPSPTPAPAAVSFSRDVLPIFTNDGSKTCAQAGCHSAADAQQGQVLEAANAYASTVNVPSMEKPDLLRVKPSDSANSYLYQKITGASGIVGAQMPLSGGPLSAAQMSTIKSWIDEGAPNN